MAANSVMVLALDDESHVRAIGPVSREDSTQRIREEIEARGWTAYGEATYQPVYEWRAELRAAKAGESDG